jgi:AcrR family transcriptional regulator
MTDTPEPIDGRHARKDRGIQVAVETTLEIFREGGVIQSMAQLAERSGISERTLFRYFTNQDGLIDAIAKHVFPQMTEFFTMMPPEGSLEIRMKALVELRVRYARIFLPMARTVERFSQQFSTAAELRRGRDELFSHQLVAWLGQEAEFLSQETIYLIDSLIDFKSIDKLLQKLDDRAPVVLYEAVMTLLGSDRRFE